MPTESHTFMDGKLHVYKRENSSFWQCSTFLGGRNHRASAKEETLVEAKDFASHWYMERCVEERRRKRGEIAPQDSAPPVADNAAPIDRRRRKTPTGPTFKQAAELFENEYKILTAGERNAQYVKQKSDQIRVHLLPFCGDKALSEVTSALVQEYRVHRQTSRTDPKTGEARRPARSTLHSEIVTFRQILKTAERKGWINGIPDMSAAYKSSGKVSHRAWFSPAEYKMLYEATRERAKHPKKERWRKACEQMHDFVLFMGNTGLRPDEAARLEDRDITIVEDDATRERILEIEVRGKRGVGYCKSMPGAVQPYERIRARKGLKPTDRLFGNSQRELFNTILDELNLKHDREGNVRAAYSLRHTYICTRLMEGADIYQIAKNCRTSVEMIEKYYASHIKTSLDAAAINIHKKKPSKKTAKKASEES
jgi:integrase